MKKILTFTMGALALTAVTATAAGKYPFPQNMKHPYGTTIEYADTDMIKARYEAWKKTWYDASQGWVLAPEGTCSTVSEAIAYGMLISVYMDDQTVFDKLYGTWTSNAAGSNGGMNWRVGCEGGTGSASDADFDAALALVMASAQWGGSYLTSAKSLISWIASNDISSNKIKPGNAWNDAFNPSYATTANFQLFQDVAGGSWTSVISQAYTDLSSCQNSSTGLVPDWCSWDEHKPTKTSASVAQSEEAGFFDDAARTPWRMAWAYYWYGDSKAKAFNEKVVKWLIPATHTASGVNSGYYVDGTAEKSKKRNFVSSTFSGGLGLATSSFDSEDAKAYFATTYKALTSLETCAKAENCGTGDNAGEKYYPATLNMLYLLLMTGNMPNLNDISKFTKFTPDPSKAPSISEIGGTQMALKDTTVGISGFWNWGGYHDKLCIGTVMVPDSGTSPLYRKADGSILAEASMEIGPEPKWTEEAAAAGTLKYPSAGIAMSFLSDDKKGVDFTALGITAVRVTMKASGPIRMAILNQTTYENDKKGVANASAGSEPGIYVPNSSDYVATTYSLTPCKLGFLGLGNSSSCSGQNKQNMANDDLIYVLDWVAVDDVPTGEQILKGVAGLKWEVKNAKGGVGELSIKSIEFLKGEEVVDPVKITGIKVPEAVTAIKTVAAPSAAKLSVAGMNITVEGAKAGSDIAVFNLQGKHIASTKAIFGNASIAVPTKGVYLVRVNGKVSKVNVK